MNDKQIYSHTYKLALIEIRAKTKAAHIKQQQPHYKRTNQSHSLWRFKFGVLFYAHKIYKIFIERKKTMTKSTKRPLIAVGVVNKRAAFRDNLCRTKYCCCCSNNEINIVLNAMKFKTKTQPTEPQFFLTRRHFVCMKNA